MTTNYEKRLAITKNEEITKVLEPITFEIADVTSGSEKQIEWAAAIQIEKWQKAIEFYKQNVGRAKTEESKKAFDTQITGLLNKVFAHSDAKYWIDNRGQNIYAMMAALAK